MAKKKDNLKREIDSPNSNIKQRHKDQLILKWKLAILNRIAEVDYEEIETK